MKFKDFKQQINNEKYDIPELQTEVKNYASNKRYHIIPNKNHFNKRMMLRLSFSFMTILICAFALYIFTDNNIFRPNNTIPVATSTESSSTVIAGEGTINSEAAITQSSPTDYQEEFDNPSEFLQNFNITGIFGESDPNSSEVKITESINFYAYLNSNDVTNYVSWSVDNSSVAEITPTGLLVIKTTGTIVITARYDDLIANYQLTIIN